MTNKRNQFRSDLDAYRERIHEKLLNHAEFVIDMNELVVLLGNGFVSAGDMQEACLEIKGETTWNFHVDVPGKRIYVRWPS